jgi:predicted pyridoxine 5'-phosphate oxidase superfamily flavin-nucleotide-binding protein
MGRLLVGKLSDTVKEIISEVHPGLVATASREGRPNVSAKGSFRVLDDDHVAFADVASPRTIANLRENPEVSILVVDPKAMKGCRVWGRGEILDSGELFEQFSKEFSARNMEVNHVVRIAVERAQESF